MDFDYTTETITPDSTNVLTIGGSGGLEIPIGTTGQRPGSPDNGLLRYNADSLKLEGYFNGGWRVPEYIIGVVVVSKNPGANEFSSITSAIASITTASSSNRFVVRIAPGTYTESTITMKEYVDLVGSDIDATVITSATTTQTLIEAINNSRLANMTITGSTGTGGKLVHYQSTTNDTRESFTIDAVRLGAAETLVHAESPTGIQTAIFLSNVSLGSYNAFNTGFRTDSAGTGKARILVRSSTTTGATTPYPAHLFYASGPGAEITMLASQFRTSLGSPAGKGVYIENGALARIQACTFRGYATAIEIGNVGSASTMFGSGVTLDSNTNDITIYHPTAIGAFFGVADTDKVSNASSNLAMTIFDTGGGTTLSGDLYLGDNFGDSFLASPLMIETPPVGLLSGGVLTSASGLVVDISAGAGYLRTTSGKMKYVSWAATNKTITAGTTPWIYIDENGVAQTTSSEPVVLTLISLGRVSAGASTITGIGTSATQITNYGNKVESWLREAVGPVYVSGSIVTENGTTARAIDITAGKYYNGTNVVSPSLKTAPTIIDIYRVSSVVTFTPVGTVPNSTYDNGTNLVSVTASYYTKHALYQASEGAYQQFYLAHAQAQYATLQEAIDAPLPTPIVPVGGVPKVAALIMQEGVNSIADIRDIRPLLFGSGSGAGGSGTSDHSDLTNLDADDHLQYLRTDGSRLMSGNLNLNSNNIINIGTANGVTIQTHGSRHLPNGADPITTATAVGLTLSSTSAEGTQNSLARSDHTHAITGAQPVDATLTALAAYNTNGILTQTSADTFVGRTIAGTTDRITLTNGNGVSGNPTVDIASTYVGQTSITTLGTVATGTWNATTIGATVGGTGQTIYAVGDLLYANTTTTLSTLAGVATGNVLISAGVNTPPSWGLLSIFPTADEKAAMTNANSPSSGNPFLTESDIIGGLPTGEIPNNFNNYDSDISGTQTTTSATFTDLTNLDVSVTIASAVPVLIVFSYTVDRSGGGGGDTVAAFRVRRVDGTGLPEQSLGMQAWMDTNGALTNGTVTFRTAALPIGTYTFRPQFRRVSGSQTVELIRGQIFSQAQQGPLVTSIDWSAIIATPTTVAGYGITDGVTAVSVASSNGFSGSSSGGQTPVITVSTSVTGVLKGDGTAISAAVSGTDYVVPSGTVANATNIEITNDTTTNSTMYPLWATANTGNLPAKVTSTKLSFNPSSGVLSSTSFTGAGTGLTGTASSLSIGGSAASATTATTATNIAGGTANQRPYQTGAGATAFYSSANYGVTTTSATGVPATIAGAAGVLQGSASAIPAFTTTPTLTGTNFTGIPNGGLTNSSVTVGSTAISLGASATTIAGLTSVTSTTFVGALTGNATSATSATTATNIAAGTANQQVYQTGAGATSFYSSANYGVQVAGATGTPQTIAGAAGVLQGSASAIPAFTTTPTLTGTNFTGIPNGGLTNSAVTIGSTSVSLGATVTTFAGLTSVTSTTFVGALTGNATSATSATSSTNIGITDDTTTNATMYPLWVTTTTGNLPAKVSSTKMSFNPSTGVLSSTSFTGAGTGLTGTASSLSIGGNATTATTSTNIAAGTANQQVYQTGAGATGFYSSANYGVQVAGATGTPQVIAGAAGVLQGSASAIPVFTTTPTLTGTNFTGIPNGGLTNSSVTVGSTAISLGASATTIAGLTSVTSTTFVGALTGNAQTATSATTATNIAAGTANQIPYQTGAGATAFYSSANYGVQVAGATGTPQAIAGAAGLLVGSAAAIPSFQTTISGLTSVSSTTFVGALTGNASSATAATNISGGALNQIPRQSGAGATTFITAPSVTNTFLQWNGSAFVWAAAGGASPLTTKGDIFTYSTVDARLPVGTNGQVLSADSAEATGLKWITNSGGSGVPLANVYAISSLRI